MNGEGEGEPECELGQLPENNNDARKEGRNQMAGDLQCALTPGSVILSCSAFCAFSALARSTYVRKAHPANEEKSKIMN